MAKVSAMGIYSGLRAAGDFYHEAKMERPIPSHAADPQVGGLLFPHGNVAGNVPDMRHYPFSCFPGQHRDCVGNRIGVKVTHGNNN